MDKRLALVITWMAVIFAASSIPGQDLEGISTPDYLLHAGEYAVLGGLLAWWCFHRRADKISPCSRPLSRCTMVSTVIGSIYGITDELHQGFVPGRCQDPRDWAADTMGTFIGALAVLLILCCFKRKKDAEKRLENP